jgi:peptidoglycan/LPS O-acetylase OafA/YrhL
VLTSRTLNCRKILHRLARQFWLICVYSYKAKPANAFRIPQPFGFALPQSCRLKKDRRATQLGSEFALPLRASMPPHYTTSDHDSRTSVYLPTLDGLRFAAFLLVFVHHLPRSDAPLLQFLQYTGWVGVHVFLLLSAYLLSMILAREYHATGNISIKRFFIRRGLRIWPLYYAFGIAAAVVTAVTSGWQPSYTIRGGLLAVFLDNVASGFWGYNPIRFVPHLWTISLEEQFYLVLPWLIVPMLRGSKHTLAVAIGVAWIGFLVARALIVACGGRHPLIWTSVVSADSLLLGTYLGAQGITIRGPTLQKVAFIAGLSLLFCVGFMPDIKQQGGHQVVVYTLVGAGAGLLCLAVIDAPWLRGILGSKVIRYLGKISYGLYVFHMLGIWTAQKLTFRFGAGWLLMAVIAFAVTAAASIASFELFEKHFLRLKRRYEFVHSRPA